MNKQLTYFIVASVIFLMSSFRDVLQVDFQLNYLLDDLIGLVLTLAGFYFLGPWVERIIRRIDESFTWSDNPVRRFLIDLSCVYVLSMIAAGLMILGIWAFFAVAGVPSGMEVQDHLRPPPPGGMAPKPPMEKSGQVKPIPSIGKRENLGSRIQHPVPFGIKSKNFREAFKYNMDLMFGSFLLFTVLFLFEESTLFTKRNEEQRFKSMQLAQDQMLSKINALKGQINPHFMFNNLNTLSGLIHEDVDRADRFISALSKNLRYVLEQNKEIIVTLDKEVDFLKSYIHLQEERFGHKLKVEVDIRKEDMDYQLPALTLELLIENALKHNIVSTTKPLVIEVGVEEEFLIVKNNYQPKSEGVVSTGIGLNNLKGQLQLLGLNGSTFGIEGEQYIARVAMLRLPKTHLS